MGDTNPRAASTPPSPWKKKRIASKKRRNTNPRAEPTDPSPWKKKRKKR
jgi:hypothetical protein